MSEFSLGAAKQAIVFAARELGFATCRVAKAGRAAHADEFLEWLAAGNHAGMDWLARSPERRSDPRKVVAEACSVISLGFNYYPGSVQPGAEQEGGAAVGRIARYAWNRDYHKLIEEKLRDLNETLEIYGGRQRFYVDTGPVLERDFANACGNGWNGKSTVQIHPKFGPWLFLCELITTLDLPADVAMADHCGKCTRCLDLCPTGAITAPHVVDARKCISYLTIENKGGIPLEYRRAVGDRIYGCDECLEVCPWNRFARRSDEILLLADRRIFDLSLRQLLGLSEDEFGSLFRYSPIKRIKRTRFLRNVCVALGNVGGVDDLEALRAIAESPDESEMLREHAQWAINEIERSEIELKLDRTVAKPH